STPSIEHALLFTNHSDTLVAGGGLLSIPGFRMPVNPGDSGITAVLLHGLLCMLLRGRTGEPSTSRGRLSPLRLGLLVRLGRLFHGGRCLLLTGVLPRHRLDAHGRLLGLLRERGKLLGGFLALGLGSLTLSPAL